VAACRGYKGCPEVVELLGEHLEAFLVVLLVVLK
jgi:hypothetical protein